MKIKEHRPLNELFNADPGCLADPLKCRALLPDKDSFLRIPFDDNVGIDVSLPLFPLLELAYLNGR